MAKFEKGTPKKGGRQKGSVNKITRSIKEMVITVANQLQDDPKANLLAVAKANPIEFYKIASRLIPTELNAKITQKVIKVVRK